MSGTVRRDFAAVVRVEDRTAAALAAISARLRGVAGIQGLGAIHASMRRMQGSFTAMTRNLTRLAVPLAALAGGAAAGLIGMSRATIASGAALQDLSARLGISVEQLQALQHAGRQSGVQADAMTGSLERLQRGIADAAGGRNANLAALFRQLRIPLRDVNGQIRTAADLMPELAEAFQRNENGAVRTRMAMALFGRAGGPMISMLSEGREALERNVEEWRELGGVLGAEQTGALKRLDDAMTRVALALTAMRDAIVVQLAPALAPMLDNLAKWIRANREIVSSTVAGWVRDLGEALSKIDWQKVRKDLEWFGRLVRMAWNAIGGLRGALLITAGVIMGPFLLSLAAFGLAVTRFIIMPLAGGVAMLARLRAGAVATAGAAAALQGAAAGGALAGAGRAAAAGLGPAGAIAGGAALLYQHINPVTPDQARRLGLPNLMAPQDGYDVTGRPIPADRSPLLRQQSAPATAAPQGQVDVRVRLEGLPRGSQVDARTTGIGLRDPQVDVGFATLGAP